jgi:hypothetical protein
MTMPKPKRTRRFAPEPLTASPAGQPIQPGPIQPTSPQPAEVQPDAFQADLKSFSSTPRAESKTAQVIALLQRPDGATLDEMIAETGWLPHTTRAALTGLKKKGHAIQRNVIDGVSRYTITSPA